jgi:hypothetical protein
LQTAALPLGYAAKKWLERETGFEPATSTLARLRSTAELFPPDAVFNYQVISIIENPTFVKGVLKKNRGREILFGDLIVPAIDIHSTFC